MTDGLAGIWHCVLVDIIYIYIYIFLSNVDL